MKFNGFWSLCDKMGVITLLCSSVFYGQVEINGTVKEYRTQQGISEVQITWADGSGKVRTDKAGNFSITTTKRGSQELIFKAQGYNTKNYPVILDSEIIQLGVVFLERDLTTELKDTMVLLSEEDLLDDTSVETASGLLQATRDIFLSKAAFDFSQVYFKVRGFDSRQGKVLINGIPMNRFYDGRPQWNNWGGLNDIARNQELDYGLKASENAFGGLLGSTTIDISTKNARPGLRFSMSAANRNYKNRLMATFQSGRKKKGLGYAFSLSRRWAEEGYMNGTPYEAYSFFGNIELSFAKHHSLGLAMINAYNQRGRSAALTDEVVEILGHRYNPYWGWQDGQLRSSRIRSLHEPILLFHYSFEKGAMRFRATLAHQNGKVENSRLGYYEAPNPDPTYYRYLPSFYLNNPNGANLLGAFNAKAGLLGNPQLNWENLYLANESANRENNAAYVWYKDVDEEKIWTGNLLLNLPFGKSLMLDAGLTIQHSTRHSYAKTKDLLGAGVMQDRDPFTDTRNDVNGTLEKGKDNIFNYNYIIDTYKTQGFLQARFSWKQWDIYVAGEYEESEFQRNGLFLNERYPDLSFGPGEAQKFKNSAAKGGISYALTSRHWLEANAFMGTSSPILKTVFINPRESNELVPGMDQEYTVSTDLTYSVRSPALTGRISAYYTRFQNTREVNFFYSDTGYGSDFFQEVVTGLDRLHKGIEMGLEYTLSPSVKGTLAMGLGNFSYASDPEVTINFDETGAEDGLQDQNGSIDLGVAKLNGLRIAQGPQTAISLGLSYRDPSYWWVGGTLNYLSKNYIDLANIPRTTSFKINPETGDLYPEATPARISQMLKQKSLPPVYLLNLVGGKSWLYKGHYISLFCSLSNVFDLVYRSGGYEQGRNGHYGQMFQDNLSGTPSFGPKYWYGYGRTFFINLAVNF